MARRALSCAVALLVAGALGSPARAANQSCPQGWLTGATPQTGIGISADTFTARGAPAIVVQAQTNGGTATVQLEICCSPFDCPSQIWAPVTGGVMTLSGQAQAAISVLQPACMYRTNVTACSGCNVRVAFACAGA